MQQPGGGGGGGEVVKWVTHYCSDHKILLVGEGDFSFSLSLAHSFGSASNIVASSLDSYDDVTNKYKQAKSNLDDLQNLGACLLHGVDATKMKLHSYLEVRRFDRIIFNFPHAGFHRKENHPKMIEMHKNLVFGFFKNASCLLRANGEIHVNHKTSAPFCYWNLEELANQSFLTLIECVDFNKEDYPGYNNKRGHSNRCDDPFPLGECSTFKFIYKPRALVKRKRTDHMTSRQQRHPPFQEIQQAVNLPTSVDFNCYPQTSHTSRTNEAVSSMFGLTNGYTATSASYSAHGMSLGSQRSLLFQPWPKLTNVTSSQTDHVRREDTVLLPLGARNEGYQILGRHSNYLQEAGGRTAESSGYNFNSARSLYERSIIEVPRKSLIGARNEGNHHVCGVSSNYLQGTLGRTPENAGSFDRVRSDLERNIAKIPISSSGARNVGYHAYSGSSNHLPEAPGATARVRPDSERYNVEVTATSNGDTYFQRELRRLKVLMSA